MKWIETYNIYHQEIFREYKKTISRFLKVIEKVYRAKEQLNEYGQISLFKVSRETLLQCTTAYLKKVNMYWKIFNITGRDSYTRDIEVRGRGT